MDSQVLIEQEFQSEFQVELIFKNLCEKLNYELPQEEISNRWIEYFNGEEFLKNDFKEYQGGFF